MTSAQSPALGYGEMAAVGSTESGHSRQLSGRLGVGSITFMVIAAAAPLTVIGGALPVSMLIGNGAGMPTMYAVTCVILLLFTVGFTAMARHIPRPGAFFTYIGFGLGRPAALSAAHLALLTYTAVQVGVYCYLGEALSGSITRLTGFTLPWWVFALATVAVVAVLGYRHIELSSKVLAVLLVAEILIVLVLGITILSQGGAEGINLDSFRPEFILSGSPALGLMFAVAAFLGFEATAIFRGEARSPDRTIPRATYLAVGIIGVFYTFSAWTLVLGIGVSKIADEVSQDPASLIIRLTSRYLGPVGGGIVDVLLVTSMFACVLSFHNVVTRYQHSMSNAAVFPNVVSRIHTAHGSPHVSSVIQTATAGLLIGIFGALQLDPVLQVFTWLGGVCVLPVVMLMLLTCIAVIVYFARNRLSTNIWRTTIAPALGGCGLLFALVIMTMNFPVLIGDLDPEGLPRFGVLSLVFMAIMLAFPVFGLIQAAALRSRKPHNYRQIIDTMGAVTQHP